MYVRASRGAHHVCESEGKVAHARLAVSVHGGHAAVLEHVQIPRAQHRDGRAQRVPCVLAQPPSVRPSLTRAYHVSTKPRDRERESQGGSERLSLQSALQSARESVPIAQVGRKHSLRGVCFESSFGLPFTYTRRIQHGGIGFPLANRTSNDDGQIIR